MRRIEACALLGLSLVLSLAGQAGNERGIRVPATAPPRRVALVIGNSDYKAGALRNPVKDSRAICAALKESGFETQCAEDQSRIAFEDALTHFADSLRAGDIALFYYAGHGFQSGQENYLAPVDFVQLSEAQSRQRAIGVRAVLDDIAERPLLQIIILDACRDNPFRPPATTRALSPRGLAVMQTPEDIRTVIAYAAAPGMQADDNPNGPNGLYTTRLLEMMRKPGLDLLDLLDATGRAVEQDSGGQQRPWKTSSGPSTPFYFKAAAGGVSGAAGGSGRSASSELSPEIRARMALELYRAIKSRTDPDESIRLVDRFLAEFSDSPLATEVELVKAKFGAVKAKTSAPPPAPPNAKTYSNPGTREIFTKDGIRISASFSSDAEVLALDPKQLEARYAELRSQIGWSETTGVAKEWWEAFEKQNQANKPILILLAEELLARKATISEFFLAYVYSDVDQVEGNLYYLDHLNANRLPYPEYVRAVNFGDVAAKWQHALDDLPPGEGGAAAVDFFKKLGPKTREENSSMLWLFQEAAKRGYSVTELRDAYKEAATEGCAIHSLLFYVAYSRFADGYIDLKNLSPLEASKQLNNANRFEEALKAAADWVEKNADDSEGPYQRGRAHLGLKRWQEAADDFEAVIRLKPTAPAWNALAISHRLGGKAKEAVDDSKKAIELDRDTLGYRLELARDLNESRDSAAADKEYDSVLAKDADNLEAIYAKIQIRLDRGQTEDVVALADHAKKVDPAVSGALNNSCYFHAKADRAAEGLDDCEAAVKAEPKSWAFIDSRGYAYYKLGRFTRAIADFNITLQMKPDAGETYYHRSLAFVAMGEQDRARADLGAAFRLGFKPGPFDALLDMSPSTPVVSAAAAKAASQPAAPFKFGFNYNAADKARMQVLGAQDETAIEVKSVELSSFAAFADLRAGDLVLTVNGKKVVIADDLTAAKSGLKTGSIVTFELLRRTGGDKSGAPSKWEKLTLKAAIPAD